MSLVINNNLMAANTARNLNVHYGKLQTSTQRLSSGLRVNSAADDAAGLAIRELMRADVAALNQGVRNANDAISMIQVADGALAVIDEKLIRMKELAEQAATGTYNSTQRLMIDSEFQAMASEINRIANATDFNGIKLIEGNKKDMIPIGIQFIENINETTTSSNRYYDPSFEYHGVGWATYLGASVVSQNITQRKYGTITSKYIEIDNEIYKQISNNITIETEILQSVSGIGTWGGRFTPPFTIDNDESSLYEILNNNIFDILPFDPAQTSQRFEIAGNTFMNFSYILGDNSAPQDLLEAHPNTNHAFLENRPHRYRFVFDIDGDNQADIAYNLLLNDKDYRDPNTIKNTLVSFGFGYSTDPRDFPINKLEYDNNVILEKVTLENEVKIHFGPMNDSVEDYYYIEKRDCTLKGLGIDDLSIETQDKAQNALAGIDEAIVKKDQNRAYYGAMQNRLENTITNLSIQAENLQASESRISDVDVATEMTNFVRNQILTQSAVAMLSQAKLLPQMVMQLLRG